MKKIKKILIIIQRSNGDVLLSFSLIKALHKHYPFAEIDLLVNDDTFAVADLLPHIKNIHIFSYQRKKNEKLKQELSIIFNIYRKYDLSINLTASDRSIIYAVLSSKKSISAVENNNKKSWWKKILLKNYYYFETEKHILENNLESLNLLKINHELVQATPIISDVIYKIVKTRLKEMSINNFLIFHPSAQYNYKIYPKELRDKLLNYLNGLGVPILITGSNNKIDIEIKKQLPSLKNIVDLIGETTLEEYFALSDLALAYIGMDTLNMHIAAGQNKPIFAIFGPTKISMWSPWSNQLKTSTLINKPIQTYGKNTIFQSSLPCEVCGMVGCGNNHDKNEFLYIIKPEEIFNEIKQWLLKSKDKSATPVLSEANYKPRKILLYIVYGDDQAYYNGAIFSFLTFKHWLSDKNKIEVFVLTEKPERFENYPVNTLMMTQKQKNEWSLNGAYHFRIKNRGLAFVMDTLELKDFDKVLFFDADTYFHKSPLPLFDLIQPNQALFYLNEGLIYDRKRFKTYVHNLEGKKIIIDGESYELSKKSALWGSLMVGIMANMRLSLDWADKLMLKFFDLVPSHTIEPFALSETLLKKYRMVEGKNFVSLYSSSRKKEHAVKILSSFFKKNKSLSITEQVNLAQKLKIKRSIYVILKQRFLRLLKL